MNRQIKKQILLAAALCVLTQGCAGRGADSREEWSFQASGQSMTEEVSDGSAAAYPDGEAASGETDGSGSAAATYSGSLAAGGKTDGSGSTAGAYSGSLDAGGETDGSGSTAAAYSGSPDAGAKTDDSGSTAGAYSGSPDAAGENNRSKSAAGETDGSGSTAEETEAAGYVYVCGAVRQPGVYEIRGDMRIFEAIALAGGMTEDADPDWVNQALPVTDGQKLQIYTKEETEQMRSSGISDENSEELSGYTVSGTDPGILEEEGAASQDMVNINTAGKDELMTLPGIGEARAEAVIRYREEHGGFQTIEEICQISGIKEAVFSNIKDRITV